MINLPNLKNFSVDMGTIADHLFFVHHHVFPMGTRVVGPAPAVTPAGEAGTHARQVTSGSRSTHNLLTPHQNHQKHEVEEKVFKKISMDSLKSTC